MKKSVMITVILSCILALFGHVIFGWLTSNAEIIKMGVTILVIDICAGDRRPVNIFATNALRAAGDVNYPFYVAGGDVECSRRTWAICSGDSVGLGHLRACGSVFAGRKYPRGYFCAPLVQHEMGKQEFYKIMLGRKVRFLMEVTVCNR